MKKIFFVAAAMLMSAGSVFAQAEKAKQDEGAAAYKAFEGEMTKQMIQQPCDENVMYTNVLTAFQSWIEADKIAETTPNAKGKIVNKNRKGNAKKLSAVRGYLINGGVFFKDDAAKALKYFATYCDTSEEPMFAEFNIAATDSMLPTIGFYAVLTANDAKDYDAIIKYAKFGVKDAENGNYAQQLKCVALKEQGKTDEWMAAINEGMTMFPKDAWFAGSLAEYYVSGNKLDEGVAYFDSKIAAEPNNYYNYFMKGFMLQSKKDYDTADQAYAKAIQLDGSNAQVYSYAGLNLWDKAGEMETNGPKYGADGYEENMAKINEVLKQAMPYFEKAREIAPDQPNLWKSCLTTIYYRTYGGDSAQYKGIAE